MSRHYRLNPSHGSIPEGEQEDDRSQDGELSKFHIGQDGNVSRVAVLGFFKIISLFQPLRKFMIMFATCLMLQALGQPALRITSVTLVKRHISDKRV